ncbi:MAG: hypothetical protein AAF405_07415 [Pseudomonadota bacterium]
MRFLFGLIVGIAVTVGVVYLMDQQQDSADKQMVNWDVVGDKVGAAGEKAEEAMKDVTNEVSGSSDSANTPSE